MNYHPCLAGICRTSPFCAQERFMQSLRRHWAADCHCVTLSTGDHSTVASVSQLWPWVSSDELCLLLPYPCSPKRRRKSSLCGLWGTPVRLPSAILFGLHSLLLHQNVTAAAPSPPSCLPPSCRTSSLLQVTSFAPLFSVALFSAAC